MLVLGFPAHATRYVEVNAHQTRIAQAIPVVLNGLHWGGHQTSPTTFTASIGIGPFSWGETLTIDFSFPNGIQVTSKCSFPLQCVDWGKNERNIRKFLDQLSSLLSQQQPG